MADGFLSSLTETNRYNTERVPEFQERNKRWAERWQEFVQMFDVLKNDQPRYKRWKGETRETDPEIARRLLKPPDDEQKLRMISHDFEGIYQKPIQEGNKGELNEFFTKNPNYARMLESVSPSFLEEFMKPGVTPPVDAPEGVMTQTTAEKVDPSWKLVQKTKDLNLINPAKRELGMSLLDQNVLMKNPVYWDPEREIFIVVKDEE